MFRVCSNIEIGKFTFDYITEVESASSWKNLTDTATIKLPRKLVTKENQLLQDVIKKGDKVVIKLGYDDKLEQIFIGYIAYIKATIPVEIKLEDEMFNHKQKSVKPISWQKASVDDVLRYVGISKFKTFGNIDLGSFQIDGKIKNIAGVFDKIKQQYGINFFYRNDTLIAGLPYDKPNANSFSFSFNRDIISHDLEYRKKEDVKIKVKAISSYLDGKKETVELGDSDGEEHTLNYYNLDKVALKARAEAEMDKLKYEGYRGKFITFGMPKISHGDIVELKDSEYPERAGKFFVDSVRTTISPNGGLRQEIELGPKASA